MILTSKHRSFFPVIALFIPAVLSSQSIPGGSTDPKLQAMIEKAVTGFRGVPGVYVRHLASGATAAVNADSLFPTASMIKVPILCALFDRIERGELGYRAEVMYRDSMKYDDGITGSFRDSTMVPISELAHLMISSSDNTASLWLQALSGTGRAINEWLDRNGYPRTKVNSRTPGRQPVWEIYGWGVTSPREMAELLVLIREGQAVSSEASQEMYRILCRSYWDDEALSQIPPYVQAASKQGAVSRSRSEVVLVNAPSGDYVFCVITKNQEDQSWTTSNEGYVLIRSISHLLWQYFESGSPWSSDPSGKRKF